MAPISKTLIADAESEEDCWEEAVEEVFPVNNTYDEESLDESLEAFAKDELGEDYMVIYRLTISVDVFELLCFPS